MTRIGPPEMLALRRQRSLGVPVRVLAERFGVSWTSAWSAATGRTWKHV